MTAMLTWLATSGFDNTVIILSGPRRRHLLARPTAPRSPWAIFPKR